MIFFKHCKCGCPLGLPGCQWLWPFCCRFQRWWMALKSLNGKGKAKMNCPVISFRMNCAATERVRRCILGKVSNDGTLPRQRLRWRSVPSIPVPFLQAQPEGLSLWPYACSPTTLPFTQLTWKLRLRKILSAGLSLLQFGPAFLTHVAKPIPRAGQHHEVTIPLRTAFLGGREMATAFPVLHRPLVLVHSLADSISDLNLCTHGTEDMGHSTRWLLAVLQHSLFSLISF